MCATEAKALYALSETDLLDLSCEYQDNPKGSWLAPMRLYLRANLQALCRNKYGSEEGLAQKKRQNAARAAKAKATRAANAASAQAQ
jgi:hypothetical protein